MHDRHPTSQLVTNGEQLFLVDCGEGTQIQMNRFKIRRSRIQHIFISHLHGDHYFGLAGLLNSYSLTNRQDPLHLYAPPPLQEILELQFRAASAQLSYPIHFHALGDPQVLVDERKISVESFPVNHRIPCWGFRFREKTKPRKIDPRLAYQAGIPPEYFSRLKEGEDYVAKDGRVIPNEEVTKPSARAVSYAYCADTRYDENILPYILDADLVYHEATYLDEPTWTTSGKKPSSDSIPPPARRQPSPLRPMPAVCCSGISAVNMKCLMFSGKKRKKCSRRWRFAGKE